MTSTAIVQYESNAYNGRKVIMTKLSIEVGNPTDGKYVASKEVTLMASFEANGVRSEAHILMDTTYWYLVYGPLTTGEGNALPNTTNAVRVGTGRLRAANVEEAQKFFHIH